MHRTDLVRRQSLTEQIYCTHLTAKHALLVELRGRTDVALVEGLLNKYTDQINTPTVISKNCKEFSNHTKTKQLNHIKFLVVLTSLVETNQTISVLEAN